MTDYLPFFPAIRTTVAMLLAQSVGWVGDPASIIHLPAHNRQGLLR
jgi:hypothetical protein